MKQIIISERALNLVKHIMSEWGHYYEDDDELKDREEFFEACKEAEDVKY
jgi:hypothetical protein